MNLPYPKLLLTFAFSLGICITTFSQLINNKHHNFNIIFIGNSITHGGGLEHPDTEAPPVKAVEWLRTQPAAGTINFKNMGFSGHTTVDFLPGGPHDFKQVEAAAAALQNDSAQLVFSLILGTNDSAVKGPNGSPVSVENYTANLHIIADQLLKEFPGCKLIFQQPTWYSPNTHNRSTYGAEGLARLQSYFPAIRAVVKSYQKTYPGQVFMGDTKAYKFFEHHAKEYLQHEQGEEGIFFLHPNKQGAAILGEYWAKAVYKKLF